MRKICLSILYVAVAGLCTQTVAQCHAPGFHLGQDFSNPEQGIGSLSISLQPKDFTVQKLSCLCQKLLIKNPKWEDALVQFFTSREAAGNMSHILSPEAPPEAKRWAREEHAFFSFNRSKHIEQLNIFPLGIRGPELLNTTIDLPVTTAPRCQLKIGSRCVMVALEEIDYPQETLKVRASGKVTVAGVIDRKGGVRQIRVVGIDVHPNDGNALASAALRDLGTWRFDSGDHNDAVQIIYTFEISTPDTLHWMDPRVSFEAPHEVHIKENPLSAH